MSVFLRWFSLPLLTVACAGDPSLNTVQDGSKQAPSWFVAKSAVDGFAPECMVIGEGDTVQWQNLDENIPANVTSLEEPPELYSPNLQGRNSKWSHTFKGDGLFAYFDTHSGDPGRPVVDAYYGTVSYVGASETAQRGTICVRVDGDRGEGACCCTSLDCNLGLSCDVANICVGS